MQIWVKINRQGVTAYFNEPTWSGSDTQLLVETDEGDERPTLYLDGEELGVEN